MLLKLAPIYLGKTVSPLTQVAELTFDNCLDLVVNPALPNKSTIQKPLGLWRKMPSLGFSSLLGSIKFSISRSKRSVDGPIAAQ
jgi:hypothetical protein